MTETGKLTELQEEIILSLADNNMNISKVANSIYRHRNAIIYHIEKIRNLTGKDPLNFHELNVLVCMVKQASLQRGESKEMTVIEFAEKRLIECEQTNEVYNMQYWAAYIDGAKAQKREDDDG